MKHIICMKWGTKFSANYVNRLYKMIEPNISDDWELHCFTEHAEGINPLVKVHPLPTLDLDQQLPERGWRKLTVLHRSLAAIFTGSALFLDLDIQILGNIDVFFEAEGEFLIYKDPCLRDKVIGNSSVFRFEVGKHQDVLDFFVNNGDIVRSKHRNEQAYLSYAMYAKGIIKYWNESYLADFKKHCLRSFPLNYFYMPIKPKEARILIFHGKPLPEQAIAGFTSKCGFRHVIPTTWITPFNI